jgi:uncharacterized membrane protein
MWLATFASAWFPDWVIGVLLAFGGCTLSNFGINMFKLAHMRIDEEAEARRVHEEWTSSASSSVSKGPEPPAPPAQRSLTCHPIWLLGAICVGLGAILDLVSFAFASVSLLAPLGAMTLVLNLFMAPLFLKEKLTMYDVTCTMIILAGTIVALCFGNKSNTSYSLQQLLALYSETAFLIYVGVFLLVLVVSFFYQMRALHRLDNPDKYSEDVIAREHRYVLLYYPTLAGVFGAHSVLGAKSAIEMIKSSISGRSPDDIKSFLFIVFILVCVVAIYLQCYFLNKGLARADALLVVPIYQVAWVLMNTILGMIYFRDWFTMTNTQVGVFCLGVVITLVGVYLLSLREKAPVSSFAKAASSVNTDGEAASMDHVHTPRSERGGEASAVDKIRDAIVTMPSDHDEAPLLDAKSK